MNWQIVDALGIWAGAVAVVVTLFYLAQQIELNAMQVERQINDGIGTRIFQAHEPIYEGRNAEIMMRGLQDDAQMSDAQRYVFNLLMYRQDGGMLELCEGVESGVIPVWLAQGYSKHYHEVLLNFPGAKKWFHARPQDTPRTVEVLRLNIAA